MLAFNNSVSSTTALFLNLGKRIETFNIQSPDNSAHTVRIGLNYRFWN